MSFWVAGAVVVGTVGSAVIGSQAAKSAANAQEQAANSSIGEQQREYDQSRSDLQPWRDAGQAALTKLQDPTANFMASPDYNFTRTQGDLGVERSAAARGGAFSGNALKALSDYNSNLASGQYNNWWNQQAGLAGVGQTATNTTTQAGLIMSGNVSNNLLQQGDARASGVINGANSWSNAVGGLAQGAGYYGSRSTPNYMSTPSPSYTNYTPPNGDPSFFVG